MTLKEIEFSLNKMYVKAHINHPYHEVKEVAGVRVSCEMHGTRALWRIIDIEDFSSLAIARKRLGQFILDNSDQAGREVEG